MSEVRRVFIDEGCTEWRHRGSSEHEWEEHSRGDHALVPWEEWEHLRETQDFLDDSLLRVIEVLKKLIDRPRS